MRNFKLKLYLTNQVQSYIYGFFLSLLFTLVPFLIIKNQYFSYSINRIIILFCAFIQIFVHFVYFLHLNDIRKYHWYLISLLFILVIIFIVVFGSIWIMFNLNHHI